MSDQHFLLVPESPDEAMEIEHPQSCPQHGQRETVYTAEGDHACPFEYVQWERGLDTYFSVDGDTHPFFGVRKKVTPGRHPVDYWCQRHALPPHIGGSEFSDGLVLSEVAG